MTTRRARLAVVVTSLGVVTALAPAAAGAAPTAPAETAGEHCVVSAATSSTTCFDSFDEAAAFASGGRVDGDAAPLGSTALDRAVERSNATAAESRAEVIGAVVFDGNQYSGSSFTITAGAPCKKDGNFEYSYSFDDGWKDRVSSVQAWANCWVWLYDSAEGEAGPYEDDTPDLGFFDDRAHRLALS